MGQLQDIGRWRGSTGATLLAAIVDSSDDAIVGKTTAGLITSWNTGAERMYGYTADEVLGQPITILSPADRIGETMEILAKIGRGERVSASRDRAAAQGRHHVARVGDGVTRP